MGDEYFLGGIFADPGLGAFAFTDGFKAGSVESSRRMGS